MRREIRYLTNALHQRKAVYFSVLGELGFMVFISGQSELLPYGKIIISDIESSNVTMILQVKTSTC